MSKDLCRPGTKGAMYNEAVLANPGKTAKEIAALVPGIEAGKLQNHARYWSRYVVGGVAPFPFRIEGGKLFLDPPATVAKTPAVQSTVGVPPPSTGHDNTVVHHEAQGPDAGLEGPPAKAEEPKPVAPPAPAKVKKDQLAKAS